MGLSTPIFLLFHRCFWSDCFVGGCRYVVFMSAVPTDYQHPAVAAVATISAGLDALGDASLWSMSTTDIGSLVIAIERIARRVAAAQVSTLAQADRSGIDDQTGSA